MASLFTKIVKGEIPAYKIAETDRFLAFLDLYPLAKGHVLVIPKKETDYIFDVDADEYIELWAFAKQIAKAMDKAIPCKRVGLAVVGLEVPHAHIHLIPLQTVEDINFSKPKLKFKSSVFEEIADKIKAHL